MGPRLGRVEYTTAAVTTKGSINASMGPRLGRVEYRAVQCFATGIAIASMGPRLGRVEYALHGREWSQVAGVLQWGHA